VDHDALVELAEARFAGLPEGTIAQAEPGRFAGTVRAGGVRADQAHLAAAYEAPGLHDDDHYATRLFSDIVGSGASSRLFQAVREERGLAYSVWSAFAPYRDGGLFYHYAATARREAAAASALVDEVLAEAAKTASERERERALAQAKAGLLMSLESSWGQASYVARQLAIHGRLVEPAEIVHALEAVTLDEIRAAGAKILSGPRARATIGVPAVRAA
ncbi:MAG: insulinase family protein, partial [Sphingomonadaceae bacterium]|nr:insulinase family protein [Sphingomonadaceae bacterium]